MFRLVGLVLTSLLGVMSLLVLVVVILLAPFGAVLTNPVVGFGGGNLPYVSRSGVSGTEIAAGAQLLADHVYGPWANEYDTVNDPFMRSVAQFWIDSCGSNGVICSVAQSGNLQCVEFVTGALFLSGVRLPYVDDAIKFWPAYASQSGWKRVSVAQSYPQPGDMVIWQGGEFGHIAIVINVSLPSRQHDGLVTVAQGNGMGNRWDASHQSSPGNWYSMPLHANGTLDTWNGYRVLGYIRQDSK
ncbi:hypothetical protein KDW_31130 [Dictyobacter vulcani]|uniref:Peptidase C51 domain-containing protein n=1 Tax=Dictyobacter vulcani TaxID=2607529 RepID=A0A5J4KRA7_9CHLR|nr:CHAP domain-containing protein [Dictyobacter vulcani]GER88951.1 hypothetical protein KDW_31130 [Dictyobacter vulcani]